MPIHATDYEYCFLPDNRGKRSVALDLKAPEATTIVRRLVERADVFLTNYRHKALERLGLTWPELERVNPRLVYAHGTGFGDCGAEADKPGFDAVCYWSRSAMEATMFPMEGWLGSLGYGTGDHPSGMALFSGVLLALLARERTGKGTRVSSSLIASGAWSNSILIQARLLETQFQERRPREEARNFTGVYYRSGDGRIFKMAIVDTEGGWPKVCRAIGRPDLIADPRYATFAERSKEGRMRGLIEMCDQIFGSQPMEHWKRALEAADVPYSVVSNYDDVVADPQLHATDCFVEVDDPELGRVRTVNTPFHLEAHPKVAPEPAPRLGEHTREVLAELGMEEREIERLHDRGVVATRVPVGAGGSAQ
jgi:crotonobetainyl-CoA:carnitine CoA-transferase CaiB-like acyl-CoA transferase